MCYQFFFNNEPMAPSRARMADAVMDRVGQGYSMLVCGKTESHCAVFGTEIREVPCDE